MRGVSNKMVRLSILSLLFVLTICCIFLCTNGKKEMFKSSNELASLDDLRGDKLSVVLVYAEWCPHCKVLIPVWDKICNRYDDEEVVIRKMEESNKNYKEFTKLHEISGFPTIVMIQDGNYKEYSGDRSERAILSYIENNK